MRSDRRKGWIFVVGQFGIAILIVISAYFEYKALQHPASQTIIFISIVVYILAATVGMLALINFKQRVTPHPIPREDYKLVSGGIYSLIRHPMYLSVILFMLGFTLYVQAYYSISLVLLLIFFLSMKIRFEEKLLIKHFPEYKEYQKRTKKLIPFIY